MIYLLISIRISFRSLARDLLPSIVSCAFWVFSIAIVIPVHCTIVNSFIHWLRFIPNYIIELQSWVRFKRFTDVDNFHFPFQLPCNANLFDYEFLVHFTPNCRGADQRRCGQPDETSRLHVEVVICFHGCSDDVCVMQNITFLLNYILQKMSAFPCLTTKSPWRWSVLPHLLDVFYTWDGISWATIL